MYRKLTTLIFSFWAFTNLSAQIDREFNQIDENGTVTQRNENGNFNKHNKDTTTNKEIPKGLYVWTIDRRLGDVIPAEPDTLPHLFMNTTFNSGFYGDYNTTGSNYTARLSRIFIDRPYGDYFIFTEPYSFANKKPDEYLFMNTLSPYTTILYDNCGDQTNGEDHIDAKFAVNANKRLNVGFELDYAYARGYYSNQNISHFSGTLFSSYLGDRYQMHFFFNAAHQKASENGGITTDEYITHPESFTDSYTESEIPTVLSQNWNRNDHQHIYLSHRYNFGFYRKVKMTEEEIKARMFAMESQKEHEAKKEDSEMDNKEVRKDTKKPTGRPEGAKIMGKEPGKDPLNIATDTTRIKINGQAEIDSLKRLQAIQDSIDATMKREYVPVTSIIHTMDIDHYDHIYQSYSTPTDYYKNTYYNQGLEYGNDSIYDQAKHFRIKNTLGLALLEGFNKYVKAGLKGYITYDYCKYSMPELDNNSNLFWNTWSEYDINLGGKLSKTQGNTLHFNVAADYCLKGADQGDFTLDFDTDLNFPLFGDTVQLAASAYLYKCYPVFFQASYHSKHFWWDNDFDRETRTRIEGTFSYQKTNTRLRVAVENINNYTYYGMSYDLTDNGGRKNLTAGVYQESDAIKILTAQLHQNFKLGPLNWENVITYQKSDNKSILPLPDWNIFTNLYLKFRIAKVLGVELGADATYFSKYYAPDFCPGINQFAVQKNEASRVELGGYPFVDVYANMTLKGVRFFLTMTNVVNGGGNHMKFLVPHYPTNGSVLHFGVSWPFFN